MVEHGYFRRRFIMRRVPRAYVVTGGPPIIVLPVSWPGFWDQCWGDFVRHACANGPKPAHVTRLMGCRPLDSCEKQY